MKRYALITVMALAMAIVLGSCSKNRSADARDLLGGVPSDASMVVVANLQGILEKMGCQVKGEKVKVSGEVRQAADSIADSSRRVVAELLFSGEGGVDPTVCVVFRQSYYTYLCGMIVDTQSFRQKVETTFGEKFGKQDGVECCSNVAYVDSRFWINLDSKTIDAQAVRHFSTLSEDLSFRSKPAADGLEEIEHDIEGWGSIGGLLATSNLGFQGSATTQVALQILFDDPTQFAFEADFLKGKAEGSLTVLNSKGKVAKFQLPSGKIDMATVESLGGSADMLIAAEIPSRLISTLHKDAKSKQPSVFSILLGSLAPLSGTTALVVDPANSTLRGVMSTNGQDPSGLMTLLKGYVPDVNTKVEGKKIVVTIGDSESGRKPVTELASSLKGAMAGAVGTFASTGKYAGLVDECAVTLVPDDGSLELHVAATTASADENFLLTLLKWAERTSEETPVRPLGGFDQDFDYEPEEDSRN